MVAGDDIGMVLSPQCFHNLNLHEDIFNHSNIHFWEYMQPGYDALGFISCTGEASITHIQKTCDELRRHGDILQCARVRFTQIPDVNLLTVVAVQHMHFPFLACHRCLGCFDVVTCGQHCSTPDHANRSAASTTAAASLKCRTSVCACDRHQLPGEGSGGDGGGGLPHVHHD